MPRAVALPIRRALLDAHQRGLAAPDLARTFRLPLRTVYHLLRLGRTRGGPIPAPAYTRPPAPSPFPSALHLQALALREQHPDWGAELIRLILARHFPAQPLPSGRSLRRWLRQAGLSRAPAGRPSHESLTRASAVHAVWQVDAADQMPLATGQLVSWFRCVDECSGAVLQTLVSPLGLERGPRASRARVLPPGLHALGPAGAATAGQRPPVGRQP